MSSTCPSTTTREKAAAHSERPIYWYIAHADAGKAFWEFSALGSPSKVYIVSLCYDDAFDRLMEGELPLSIGGPGKSPQEFSVNRDRQ